MAAVSSRLVAIIAPGSVEALIGRLLAGIFADHGHLSAAALPPLIPVAFLADAGPAAGLLRSLERAARAPWRVRTAGVAWDGGVLYIAVNSGGLWATLRRDAETAASMDPAPLFPVFEGFHAGCREASPEQRPLIQPVVPDLSFTSGWLAVVAIRSPRGRDAWWRDVRWEFEEQRPLRGRRDV